MLKFFKDLTQPFALSSAIGMIFAVVLTVVLRFTLFGFLATLAAVTTALFVPAAYRIHGELIRSSSEASWTRQRRAFYGNWRTVQAGLNLIGSFVVVGMGYGLVCGFDDHRMLVTMKFFVVLGMIIGMMSHLIDVWLRPEDHRVDA